MFVIEEREWVQSLIKTPPDIHSSYYYDSFSQEMNVNSYFESKMYHSMNILIPKIDIDNTDYLYISQLLNIKDMDLIKQRFDGNRWFYLHKCSFDWAKPFLEKNPPQIKWELLSSNPSEWVGQIIQQLNPKLENIDWEEVSNNPSEWAGKMVMKNIDKINWAYASGNPAEWAKLLLEQNPLKINYAWMCRNPSEWAGKIITNNVSKIHWLWLCENPSEWAGELVMSNPNKINFEYVSVNPSIWAKTLLEQHPHKIVFERLLENESDWAMELIRQNVTHPDVINMHKTMFLLNPAIFIKRIDYNQIEERFRPIRNEIIKNRFHPRNIDKFDSWGYGDDNDN